MGWFWWSDLEQARCLHRQLAFVHWTHWPHIDLVQVYGSYLSSGCDLSRLSPCWLKSWGIRIYATCEESPILTSGEVDGKSFGATMWSPRTLRLLVYSPHEYYRYIYHKSYLTYLLSKTGAPHSSSESCSPWWAISKHRLPIARQWQSANLRIHLGDSI